MKEKKINEEKIEIIKNKSKRGTDYTLISAFVLMGLAVLITCAIAFGEFYARWRSNHEWQFPAKWVGFTREINHEVVEVQQVPQEQEQEKVTVKNSYMWSGKASWYGAKPEWCIGCNENFIMANGEKLDDSRMTIAFNDLPLGSWVVVTNVNSGLKQQVEVTDTGGFENHGKIADLSYALKEALDCGDVCEVVVEKYK